MLGQEFKVGSSVIEPDGLPIGWEVALAAVLFDIFVRILLSQGRKEPACRKNTRNYNE